MSEDGCISIDIIYNDQLKKGLCVGVCGNPRTYKKDVVRMCWVGRKPSPNAKCDVNTDAQMTPAEAVGVGVALIRSSIVGETLLKRIEEATKVAQKEKPTP